MGILSWNRCGIPKIWNWTNQWLDSINIESQSRFIQTMTQPHSAKENVYRLVKDFNQSIWEICITCFIIVALFFVIQFQPISVWFSYTLLLCKQSRSSISSRHIKKQTILLCLHGEGRRSFIGSTWKSTYKCIKNTFAKISICSAAQLWSSIEAEKFCNIPLFDCTLIIVHELLTISFIFWSFRLYNKPHSMFDIFFRVQLKSITHSKPRALIVRYCHSFHSLTFCGAVNNKNKWIFPCMIPSRTFVNLDLSQRLAAE